MLKLQEKVVGPEHPDTLLTRSDLAEVFYHQNKYTEAETEFREVLIPADTGCVTTARMNRDRRESETILNPSRLCSYCGLGAGFSISGFIAFNASSAFSGDIPAFIKAFFTASAWMAIGKGCVAVPPFPGLP